MNWWIYLIGVIVNYLIGIYLIRKYANKDDDYYFALLIVCMCSWFSYIAFAFFGIGGAIMYLFYKVSKKLVNL